MNDEETNRGWLRRLAYWVGWAVAVLGGAVGFATYLNDRAIKVQVESPKPFPFGLNAPEDGPIQLDVVNNSERSVNLKLVRLVYKGRQVGVAEEAVTDPQAVTRLDPVELRAKARDLPVSIAAGSSSPIALLPTVDMRAAGYFGKLLTGPHRKPPGSTPSFGVRARVTCPTGLSIDYPDPPRRETPQPPRRTGAQPDNAGRKWGGLFPLRRADGSAAKSNHPRAGPGFAAARKLVLELIFDPGGPKRVSAYFELFGDPSDYAPGGTTDFTRGLEPNPWVTFPVEARRGWIVGLELENVARGRQVRWLYVQSPLQDPGLATLQIWSETAATPREFTRPLTPGQISCFPLRSIDAGRYHWALQWGGDTVAVGTLTNPCPKVLLRRYRRRLPGQPLTGAVCDQRLYP
jgi:hypothetical protein